MTTDVTTDEQRVIDRCDELLAEHDPEDDAAAPSSSARSTTLGLAWVHFPEGFGGLGRLAEAAEHDQRAS